jgi:hypothetical protein
MWDNSGMSREECRKQQREKERAAMATKSLQGPTPHAAPLPRRTAPGPVIAYLRKLGIGALLLGVAGMIFPAFFWWATGLFFTSAALWSLDVWLEPSLTRTFKGMIQFFIAAVVAVFIHGIVLFPANPKVVSVWAKSDYPSGSDINGIRWHQGLSELRVSFTNPTDRDFDDLDISIFTTEAVFQVVQVTSIPCVSVSEEQPIVHDSLSNVWQEGPKIGPRRFRCDKLPRHAIIQFLLALGNLDNLLKTMNNGKSDPAANGGDGIFGLLGPKRKPQQIIVTANYRVTFRPYSGGIRSDVGNL